VLHQFLSAETVQVSEEGVFLGFLGVLFLGHNCTVLETQPHVNLTDFLSVLMASTPNYVKKQLTVDTVSWTAIAAPRQGICCARRAML
jgi:hypothetical protein